MSGRQVFDSAAVRSGEPGEAAPTPEPLLREVRRKTTEQLAASVAHELNNPVNYVLNSLDPIQRAVGELLGLLRLYEEIEELPADAMVDRMRNVQRYRREVDVAQTRESLDLALTLAEQGARNIERVTRNLSRRGGSDRLATRPVDVRRVLEEVLVTRIQETGGRVVVERSYRKIPLVPADPVELRDLFLSVISYALRCAGNPGHVEIALGYRHGHVVAEVTVEGPTRVVDGPCHDLAVLALARHQRTDDEVELAICRDIVAAHGGRLDTARRPDGGHTISVWLPIVEDTGRRVPCTPGERRTRGGPDAGDTLDEWDLLGGAGAGGG